MLIDEKFRGRVFHDQIAGSANAVIELGQTALRVYTESDGEFTLSYSECELEMGGSSRRMLFCRSRDKTLTVTCGDRRFPEVLEAAAGGLLSEPLERLAQSRRRRRRRAWLLGITVIAVCLGLLVGGYFGVLAAARMIVKSLPLSVDRKIGEFAIQSIDVGGNRVQDPELTGPVEEMVSRLEEHLASEGFTFDVRVVHSPEVNAFALPGGPIVVYTGLLKAAESPEQVAGVLAHEMAHVTHRHGLQRIAQSVGIVAAVQLLIGDIGGLGALGAEVLEKSAINSYSREQEEEADLTGARVMHDAGLDPLAMASFFELLKEEHGDLPGFTAWISTHPQHDQRIKSIQDLRRRLPEKKYEPLELDWNKIQEQLDALGEPPEPMGRQVRVERWTDQTAASPLEGHRESAFVGLAV